MARKKNLLKALRENYTLFESSYDKNVYAVFGKKITDFMGAVEEREDGVYFCPFDVGLERLNEKIETVGDFATRVQKYRKYWEEKGLNFRVGDETFRHCYRLELALSLFLDDLCGGKSKKDVEVDFSATQTTIIDGVSVSYGEGEDENTLVVCVSLGDGGNIIKTFGSIPQMLNFVGGVFGVMALERAYPLLGAIDKLSKKGFLDGNVGDEVVRHLNLSTMAVERCTLRDYMLEKLEEGIKALKGGKNEGNRDREHCPS